MVNCFLLRSLPTVPDLRVPISLINWPYQVIPRKDIPQIYTMYNAVESGVESSRPLKSPSRCCPSDPGWRRWHSGCGEQLRQSHREHKLPLEALRSPQQGDCNKALCQRTGSSDQSRNHWTQFPSRMELTTWQAFRKKRDEALRGEGEGGITPGVTL